MRLLAAAELRRRNLDVPVPISLEAVVDFAAKAREDTLADEITALWLVDFAEDEAEVWHVISPLAAGRLAGRTLKALPSFIAKVSDDEHFRFVDRVLTQAVADHVDDSLYDAVGLSEVQERRIADRLIELYSEASNLPARKTIMSLWRTLSPSSQAVRRRLVENIYIPLAGSGSGGFDTALSFFGLVAPVENIRNEVRAALRTAAPSETARKKVEKKFEEAGWRSKKKLLGKQRDL